MSFTINRAMAAHLDALGYAKDMQFEFRVANRGGHSCDILHLNVAAATR